MGCGESKLDELPAVALCRDRHRLLASAINHRHDLARAHAAYARSLLSVGAALRRFLDSLSSAADTTRRRPRLPPPPPHHHSHDSDCISSSSSSPAAAAAGELHVHYARRRPQSPETFFAPPAAASHETHYPASYHHHPWSTYDPYQAPYAAYNPAAAPPPPLSSSPPPAPSPPRSTGWDFLNPFQPYEDDFYAYRNANAAAAAYTPSRSSREVREEEGIPDLEDDIDDDDDDLDPRAADVPAGRAAGERSPSEEEEFVIGGGIEPTASIERDATGAGDLKRPERPAGHGSLPEGVSEVMQVITAQFDRASESAGQVSQILEVGRLRTHDKTGVSSRILEGVVPPFTCYSAELNFQVREVGTGNLSSTLQKLYIWEKKLYDEVKGEEKMRILYDRCCRRLKRLDRTGAEAHKVDAARAKQRKLSTKIRVATQVVFTISGKINKLRNEELWPQIYEVIQGITRMWRDMLECHHTQSLAISEARSLKVLPFGSDEATKQLELEILDWIANFSAWIKAQKGYVRALNTWLSRCLHSAAQDTKLAAVASPGRLGAPPVFVVCNDWCRSMDRVSEAGVVDAMQAFAANVLRLWEQHAADQQSGRFLEAPASDDPVSVHGDGAVLARKNKKADRFAVVRRGGAGGGKVGRLQVSLRRIFEAMEEFTASSVKVYEELCLRSDELTRLSRSNAKVP